MFQADNPKYYCYTQRYLSRESELKELQAWKNIWGEKTTEENDLKHIECPVEGKKAKRNDFGRDGDVLWLTMAAMTGKNDPN